MDNDNSGARLNSTQYLHLTAALLVTLGRWWCDLPQSDMDQLKSLTAELRPERGLNQMTPGNRAMLREFDDHKLADRLLCLPSDTVDRFRSRSGFTKSELRLCRRAAMCELALATALRPKNLAALKLGTNVFERAGKIHVHVPYQEVKNKVALEFILPEATAQILRFYITKIRPLLCGDDSGWLWPGGKEGPLGEGYVGQMLGDFTENQLGVRVTGHRFRHVAGYIYLLDNPGGYEVVRLLLGHRSIKTTMTFYCSLETREGYKRYDAFISRRRRAIRDGEGCND